MPPVFTPSPLGLPGVTQQVRADRLYDVAAFPMPTPEQVTPVEVEEAPLPPADSTFYGVGRGPGSAPTPLRMFRGTLAISEWTTIIGWPFSVPKIPEVQQVDMPRGRQNPIRGRTNIRMGKQVALGNQVTLAPNYSTPVSNDYAKLL